MYPLKAFILITFLLCTSYDTFGQMDSAQFTKAYLNVLEEKYPDVSYQITRDLEIEAEKNGKTVTHFLDNAYNSYTQEPSALDNILETYSKSAGDLYISNEQLDTTRIVPIIKDFKYLEELSNKSDKIGLVFNELNEELLVIYAEDKENSISYFDEEKLEQTSFRGELHALAIKNLEQILPDIEKHGDEDLFMLTAGGDYEASLILLDFIWTKENFPVKGEIVIAVPSRDLLLVTGSENTEGLEKMKRLANETIETGNYTLNSSFFVRSEGSWKKFDRK